MRLPVLLAVLVVLAGCGSAVGSDGPTAAPTATSTSSPSPAHPGFADPATDRLGWAAGYWYDEPLPVNATGGLDASERAAVVGRTMARIERLRGLEFESAVPVEVVDRETYLADGTVTATAFEEVGEAVLLVGEERSVVATFAETFHLQRPSRPHRAYNYIHPVTAGWVGDRLVPYRNGTATGYVLRTEWATAGDAAAFAIAYRDLLRTRRGAERHGGDTLVVPAGPYADAFRVTRNGTTVTVVNAPTVEALDGVHARRPG